MIHIDSMVPLMPRQHMPRGRDPARVASALH